MIGSERNCYRVHSVCGHNENVKCVGKWREIKKSQNMFCGPQFSSLRRLNIFLHMSEIFSRETTIIRQTIIKELVPYGKIIV